MDCDFITFTWPWAASERDVDCQGAGFAMTMTLRTGEFLLIR